MPDRKGRIAIALVVGVVATMPAQAPRVRDKGGVRIENPAVASGPVRFRLAAKPEMVVGGLATSRKKSSTHTSAIPMRS